MIKIYYRIERDCRLQKLQITETAGYRDTIGNRETVGYREAIGNRETIGY